MIEIFFLMMFSFALIGSLAAGIWDLKTTDIPDEITAIMGSFGIFSWFVYALTTGNFAPLTASVVAGSIFLIFGWILYKTGQWGGGDATLMAAIAFMIPLFPGIPLFSISFAINVFVAGAVWNIIYSLAYGVGRQFGIMSEKTDVIGISLNEMRKPYYIFIILISTAFLAVSLAFSLHPVIKAISGISLFLSIFLPYARVVEYRLFRKTIDSKDLREGDVMISKKIWIGITKEEVDKLRKTGKRYEIKTGVPFGMAFPIALIATLLFGNLILIFTEFMLFFA